MGRRKAWSVAEVQRMARLEANYKGKTLNQFLSGHIHRTIDAIKGRRRHAQCKSILEQIKADIDEFAEDTHLEPESPTSPEKHSSQDPGESVAIEHGSILQAPTSSTPNWNWHP